MHEHRILNITDLCRSSRLTIRLFGTRWMVPLPATRVIYGNHMYLYCHLAAKRGGRLVSACQASTPKCPRQKTSAMPSARSFASKGLPLFHSHSLLPPSAIYLSTDLVVLPFSWVSLYYLTPRSRRSSGKPKPNQLFPKYRRVITRGKPLFPRPSSLGAPRPHTLRTLCLPFLSCRRYSQTMPTLIPIFSHNHANTFTQARIPVRISTLR